MNNIYSPQSSHSLQYRPDIDGLRAVAIIPVVLYHLGFSFISGGFVGVDIFFVISGFLICSIIFRETENQQFSMIDFWERRARRILPAMVVLIIATLIVGWLLLAPKDLSELGRSARAQALFSANIFFWQESGYFDSAAEYKPLLHMWSLAVEEQFYLFLPLLLILLTKYAAPIKFTLLLLIMLASLGLSQWSVSVYPEATFYLLHTRAWELLLGGLLAMPCAPQIPRQSGRQFCAIAGFLLILFSIFYYDRNTVFPGWNALPPTLGAALIILAGPTAWVNRVLSSRLLVAIGLISYSWYLWHWPMIAYARYWLTEDYALQHQIILFFAGLLLAFISWRFIETPFRKRRLCASRKTLFTAALICLLLIMAIGQQIRRADGYPERLSKTVQQYAASGQRSEHQRRCRVTAENVNADQVCTLGNTGNQQPLFLAWGDSHTEALLPLYDAISEQHQLPGWYASKINCPPILKLQIPGQMAECPDLNEAFINLALRHHIPHVILAGNWLLYLHGEEDGNQQSMFIAPTNQDRMTHYAGLIRNTVATLRQADITVWIIKQVPLQMYNPPHYLSMRAMQNKPTADIGRPYSHHLDQQQEINALFDAMAVSDNGVKVLNPADIFCTNKDVCRMEAGGYALYRDNDHLSPTGALYLLDMMIPFVNRLQEK